MIKTIVPKLYFKKRIIPFPSKTRKDITLLETNTCFNYFLRYAMLHYIIYFSSPT